MKLANISLTALALLLASAPAMSADLSVQGQLITSQGKLSSGKSEVTDTTTGETFKSDETEKGKSITAPGAGVNLQYKLTDSVSLNGGVAFVNYDGGKEKGQYNDLSVSVNGTYDFFKQDALALYGLGGLSYHMVDPKDQKDDDGEVKFKSADLVNYDLGVGGRYEIVKNVNLGLTYRYTDTLSKGTFNTTGIIATDPIKAKIKDVSLQQNELIASVGYSF